MIDKLTIQNFQSHKHSELEFHPGVNAIIGKSDSGKSSILRALYWICFNRPGGFDFIRHREERSQVILESQDSPMIRRIKGNKQNEYTLAWDNDTQVYKAMGSDVPDHVRSILNISSINMQKQMDPPFLLSQTSGQVGKYLNEITNLSLIDSSLSNIKKTFNEEKRNLQTIKNQKEELEQDLKNYENLDEFESQLKTVKKKQRRLEDHKEQVERLENLIAKYNRNKKIVSSFNWLDEIDLTLIEEKQSKLYELRSQKSILESKIDLYQNKKNSIQKLEEELNNLEEQFHNEMPDICPLCEQEIKK